MIDLNGRYQESLYPQLWRGLIRLWVPALGNYGQKVPNLVRSSYLPYTVTAPSDTTAITAQTLGTLRNDFNGYTGIYVVPATDIRVTHLGRWKVAGNSSTSTIVYIKHHGSGNILGSVTLDLTTGSNGAYLYGELGNTILLRSGEGYDIVSRTNNGGDQWYDTDTTVTKSADITTVYSAYCVVSTDQCNIPVINRAYGPVNFKYVNGTPATADAILSTPGLWNNTRSGSAIKGSGINGYLSAPGHQLIRFSHEAWYVPVTTTTQCIMGIAEYPGASTHDRSLFLYSTGVPGFYCYDGGFNYAYGTTVAVSGRPIHIVGTYDGSLGRIYVNGKQEGSVSAGNPYQSYSTPEMIFMYGEDGAGTIGGTGNGYLLKAAVYNRVLTPAEVRRLGSDPLSLLRRKPKMIFTSESYSNVASLRPPQPPVDTESELLVPISDISVGGHWSADLGGNFWDHLDEGDAHPGYPDTVSFLNTGTPSGELKLGIRLPQPGQYISRFTIHAYATTNGGTITATLYVNGSAVPITERLLVPDTSGSGGWYELDYGLNETMFSNDITSLQIGLKGTSDFSSGILDSIYLQYGGTCPTNCTSMCARYIITGGGGDFYDDVYTLEYTGGCTWSDNYGSYGDRLCTLSCDPVNGWQVVMQDTNLDITEIYASGMFTKEPPIEQFHDTGPGQVYIGITAYGAGAYGKQYPDLYLKQVRKSRCKSGGMFMVL